MTCQREPFPSRTKARRVARVLAGGPTPPPVWCAVCRAYHLPVRP